MKKYKFGEPEVTEKQMTETLVKGLGRDLTEQESNTIKWLSDAGYESRGVLLDLFKELTQKK